MKYGLLLMVFVGVAFATPYDSSDLPASQKMRIVHQMWKDTSFSVPDFFSSKKRTDYVYTPFWKGAKTFRFSNTPDSLVPDFIEAHRIISKTWPKHLHIEALKRVYCESRYRFDAVNSMGNVKGIDYGGFQINDEHQGPRMKRHGYTVHDIKNPEKNSEYAYIVYKETGWSEWYLSDACFNDPRVHAEVTDWYNKYIN